MPDITLHVADQTWQSIVSAFDGEAREADVCATFAELAVEHHVAWISGQRRYNSLSEQYADWIQSFYERLLPADEAPTLRRIYNSFNVPYGQALYIARILGNRALKRWRDRAGRELYTALNRVFTDARTFVAKGEPDQFLAVRVSRLANVELVRLCDGLAQADESFLPPRPRGGYGDTRQVEVPAQTVLQLLQLLEPHA